MTERKRQLGQRRMGVCVRCHRRRGLDAAGMCKDCDPVRRQLDLFLPAPRGSR